MCHSEHAILRMKDAARPLVNQRIVQSTGVGTEVCFGHGACRAWVADARAQVISVPGPG